MRLPLLLVSALCVSTACRTVPKPDDGTDGLLDGDASVDTDGDGFTGADDCDEGDASIHSGAEELCNGIDDNCDGQVDEGVRATFWADTDGDGFGDPAMAVEQCAAELGLVTNDGDCNDADSAVHPGADEVCNGIDDDCDVEVDEEGRSVWYFDVDDDGFGDPETAFSDCSPGDGAVADGTDCDDTDADIFPGADETCNERDDDCDDEIDEGVLDVFYVDLDSDGWGDPSATTQACAEPEGYAAAVGDCDDADAAVNPDGSEVCNGIDDNCDGAIDDADPTLDPSTTSTWYADSDGDGYGDVTVVQVACVAPSGFGADATDCDDADAAIHPAATEICNTLDDDCDGAIDDADPSLDLSTATTWYADTDGDGFGDASSSTTACLEPSGYLADDTDCDDTSALASPDGVELRDGEDNDCDGTADDDLYKGTGADGSLTVSATTDLSVDASGSRTVADAVAYGVTAISSATVTLDGTGAGLAAGDEVLIINLQGTDTAYNAVGTYTLGSIESVGTGTVTLHQAITEVFGESSNTDLSGQTIVLQRIPHYTDVTIDATGTLTASVWDGSSGGILAFRATGSVSVAAGGLLSADALGYSGGATGTSNNCDAFQGESYAGLGDGDGDGVCTAYNESYGHWDNNFGGGGAHITGAGGAYAAGATDGDSWTGGGATPPYAGDTYGDVDLATLFFGSGGGGVWNGGTDTPGEDPGPGGDGGGILMVGADTLTASGAASITSYGGTTHHWASGTWTYGAGGGAGGSIWLQVETLSLGTDAVDASGGFGESTHIRAGGDGGAGRVRIDCVTCNGNAQGTTAADTALEDAAEPDPGYSEVPL